MEDRKAILIVGRSGDGVALRAKVEAEKIGGDYRVTSWSEIQNRFGLGGVLRTNPDVVIVEDLDIKSVDSSYIKNLVSGDDLLIEEKYKDPRTVSAPTFIFTMLAPHKLGVGPAEP